MMKPPKIGNYQRLNMSSTYSTSLRIQLITTGTENEAWGTPTDNNFGTIIEQAITGVNAISLTGLSTLTLSAANAAVDQSRNAVLVFTGTPSANCNVVAPSVNKVYIVSNQTTGGYNVNMKTSGGDILAIPPGSRQLIFCNGTVFTSVVDPNAINGNLSISGSVTVGGNVTAGTNVVLGKNITGNNANLTLTSASNIVSFQQNTGALKLPYGTTGQRPSNTALGMQRWNSDLGVVEVWNGSSWLAITGATQGTYLVVAGGGGGGWQTYQGSGGGGAGGLLTGTFYANVSTSYSIVVGSGGGVNAQGANSSAFGVVAIGGGSGAGSNLSSINGGSGGGKCTRDAPEENFGPGSGTSGQGYAGSSGISGYIGAGGGGASQVGQGISGGAGIASSITGSSVTYAGGGGGGDRQAGVGGSGGAGGGGTRSAGTPNTGGGGAGGGSDPGGYGGGSGGSGVVIAAYASSYQRATGGTVTTYTNGGITYYVHTFTSSGTLAF